MKNITLVLMAVAFVGCVHTQEVEKGNEGASDGQQKPAAPVAAKKSQPSRTSKTTPKTSSPDARPPVEEGRPELSVSPQGLLLPDGPRLIQQALSRQGYLPADHQTGKLDPETSAALRKFQGDQSLAKTGSPDRETVRKLGLSVEKVFRSSTDGPRAERTR